MPRASQSRSLPLATEASPSLSSLPLPPNSFHAPELQVVTSPRLLPSPDGRGVVRAGVQLGGGAGGIGAARVAITGGTGGLGLLVAGAQVSEGGQRVREISLQRQLQDAGRAWCCSHIAFRRTACNPKDGRGVEQMLCERRASLGLLCSSLAQTQCNAMQDG